MLTNRVKKSTVGIETNYLSRETCRKDINALSMPFKSLPMFYIVLPIGTKKNSLNERFLIESIVIETTDPRCTNTLIGQILPKVPETVIVGTIGSDDDILKEISLLLLQFHQPHQSMDGKYTEPLRSEGFRTNPAID